MVKVFVSYSWATEQDTGIVDQLEQLCPPRGIQLIRDKNVLVHGASIDKFMGELSEGDHVITIFSKPYFESTWCMYELLKIYQKGRFETRTHPIIADDCDLQNEDYRLAVSDFWKDKLKKAEQMLEGRDPKDVLEEHKRVINLRDIKQKINEIQNFAAYRVNTPLTILQTQNYAQLLDNIRLEKQAQGHPTQATDADYLQAIQVAIETDLNKPEHELFREKLKSERGHTGQQLAAHLINSCISGDFVAVIQAIESSFVDCYDALDQNDYTSIKKLYDIAEGTVSKLVVFNIKNDWITQYRDENPTEHSLPDMSLGHIGIIHARGACTLPKFDFNKKTKELQSRSGLESGIKASDQFADIIRHLYCRVKEAELPTGLNTEQMIVKLQITLKQRKQKTNIKLHKSYFLLIPSAGSSALADKDVQAMLKQALPDLSLIHIKAGDCDEIFIVEDEELMTALGEFFNTLENQPGFRQN